MNANEKKGLRGGPVHLKTYKNKPEYKGVLVVCPKCGRILAEAEFVSLLKRCPKCKHWVLAIKKVDIAQDVV